jgi:hypothetical protein
MTAKPAYVVLEPKICERCGVNFLRPQGSADRYCRWHHSLEIGAARPQTLPPAPITPEEAWENLRAELALL